MNNQCLVKNSGLFSSIRSGYGVLILLVMMVAAAGCTGLQTFSQSVQAGDTVAIAINRQDIKKGTATIVITDALSNQFFIPGNDPSVRGWIHAYPDPVSRLVVGRETSQGLNASASAFGLFIESGIAAGGEIEKDLYLTSLYLDLPNTLQPGAATVDVQVASVSILPQPIALNILPGISTPHPFDIAESINPLSQQNFRALERAKHFTVSFSATVVPEAIEVKFSHNPDRENGGVGQAYVSNPRGDVNNIFWTDDGANLHVVVLPAWYKTQEDINAEFNNDRGIGWFKFYVAGDITGLTVTSVDAYDLDGNTVAGVTATIQ